MSGDAWTIGYSPNGIGSCPVAKKRISAKEAVADIRSGMDDSALMKKYNLLPDGLQSLFDKLVNAGFIDLAEMQRRLSGFLGTVVISESDLSPHNGEGMYNPRLPDSKSPPRVHAQQASRDIRLGMSDFVLMEKYRLSAKGLQSLFDKLVTAGLLTRGDFDRRGLGIDDTVDLREEMLSLSGALRYYDADLPGPPPDRAKRGPKQSDTDSIVKQDSNTAPPSGENHNKEVQEASENPKSVRITWYDKPVIVMLLLIGLFPLGFYALYRNSTFSTTRKVFMTAVWVLLAIACLMLIPLQYDWSGLY